MINPALLSSRNMHYCTPPKITVPMKRVLVPKGSGRRLLDPSSNGASIVGAHLVADGDAVSGLDLRWSDADAWYNNPPYGKALAEWIDKQVYWGRTVGVPGIGLVPARPDPVWARRLFANADAWLFVDGRLTFWVPIPIEAKDAAPARKRRGADGEVIDDGPYYLRRWHPQANDDNLPAPFRLLEPGMAVGPELGANGLPQAAPFPSLVAFFADSNSHDVDPRDELDALRELVRTAVTHVPESAEDERWQAEAEAMLGSRRYSDRAPLDLAPFDRLVAARQRREAEHPIDVRTFYKHFGRLGTVTIARGPHRGVYMPKVAA